MANTATDRLPLIRNPQSPGGFTLVELVVVIALIGIISAITFPQLLPVIAFSKLEGSARHLAGFGRSAVAYSTLMREPITVKFDLNEQEYWAVHQFGKISSLFDDDEEDLEERMGPADMLDMLANDEMPDEADLLTSGADLLRERFEHFARVRMEALSSNVKREGILDEIGPLFDEEFTLDDDEEDREIYDPVLMRTSLPAEVVIESIQVGDTHYAKGTVDVEFSPLGLYTPVVFHLRSEADEYYTVAWDPITGSAHLEEGKEDLLDLS